MKKLPIKLTVIVEYGKESLGTNLFKINLIADPKPPHKKTRNKSFLFI